MATRSSPDCPSARRRLRAFTLVEVAFAVVVLAIAITTALAAMQRAFLHFDAARNLQLAASILQSEIEKERLLSWSQVSDPGRRPAIDAALLRSPLVAGRFTLSRALSVVPERNGQMVQVTLTVTWRTFTGQEVSRSHTTFYCRDGLYNLVYLNV